MVRQNLMMSHYRRSRQSKNIKTVNLLTTRDMGAFRLIKYISIIIVIAFSLQGCASYELRYAREGDIYKTEKMSSRIETSYNIRATSPTQIRMTVRTDSYETYRRYYEEIEDITIIEASWKGSTYVIGTIGGLLTLGAIPLKGQEQTEKIVKICSYDGQIIRGNVCSIKTKSGKTGYYIKKDEEVLLNSKEAVIASGNVMVAINGRRVDDISIKSDGTAELDLFKFPELIKTKKDVNIEYQYRNAVISTTLESAISYAAKRILSEIRSKGWSRVAVVELKTKGMPEGFQESLMEEIELQHTQDKKNSVVKPALISKALIELRTNFADILKPTTSGKITDVCEIFGKLIDADGIIGGNITKRIETTGMKNRPDIFGTKGIQFDLKFVDIEKGNTPP